jgi:hypothetical protein
MHEEPRPPAGERVERVERRETVTTGPEGEPPRVASATPMWLWIMPLVLVVVGLVWFIFTQAEPRSPVDPVREVEIVAPEINIGTSGDPGPAVELPSPAPQEPAAPPITAPAEPPAAATEGGAGP